MGRNQNKVEPPCSIFHAGDIKTQFLLAGGTQQSFKMTPAFVPSVYPLRRQEKAPRSAAEPTRLSPSVSVALLITWLSLVFRLVEVVLFLPRFSTRPVPTETTHSSGVLGHKHLDSWTASAVGLLIRRPPSCTPNKRSGALKGVFDCKTWKNPNNCCSKPHKRSWISTINGRRNYKDHLMEQREEIYARIQSRGVSSTVALISNIILGRACASAPVYPGWWWWGGLVERLGVMLNRHEAEGPRGWQQDQTHRGQSSLKRPGWGGGCGSWGAPSVYFLWPCVHGCLIEKLVSS